MAQTSDERLLELLQPEAAGEGCKPGFKLQKMQHCLIGPPIVPTHMVKVGRQLVSRPTPDGMKQLREWNTMRFEVLDRSSPLALEIFEKSMEKLAEYQRGLAPPSKPAAPVADRGKRPAEHELRVIRI